MVSLRTVPPKDRIGRRTFALVSGAATLATVHLLPLGYLQDRGLLERTVRRALVRV